MQIIDFLARAVQDIANRGAHAKIDIPTRNWHGLRQFLQVFPASSKNKKRQVQMNPGQVTYPY